MSEGTAHVPVLAADVVDALVTRTDGIYVDCTFGRGGHTAELLARLAAGGRVLALDRDPAAAARAGAFEADPRFGFFHAPFSDLAAVLREAGVAAVTGILADLGVSSPQLDDATRGFSFSADGPLDMRMDPTRGETAAAWLARVGEKELADTLYLYGEERYSRRIARALVNRRREEPIVRTAQLSRIVAGAVPHRPRGRHPATRTFQAIRIAVNRELEELAALLAAGPRALEIGGRMAVIAFHSLEDREVKLTFRDLVGQSPAPRDAAPPAFRLHRRLVKPDADEIARNPRARSARLRVLERIA